MEILIGINCLISAIVAFGLFLILPWVRMLALATQFLMGQEKMQRQAELDALNHLKEQVEKLAEVNK